MSLEFTLYDVLVSINVPAEKARAVIDALEHDMASTLATKQDILLVKQELEHGIDGVARDVARLDERLTRELELLRSSMTVRLGSIQVVAIGLLFAALKLTKHAPPRAVPPLIHRTFRGNALHPGAGTHVSVESLPVDVRARVWTLDYSRPAALRADLFQRSKRSTV
jgi:hypothetical protein